MSVGNDIFLVLSPLIDNKYYIQEIAQGRAMVKKKANVFLNYFHSPVWQLGVSPSLPLTHPSLV